MMFLFSAAATLVFGLVPGGVASAAAFVSPTHCRRHPSQCTLPTALPARAPPSSPVRVADILAESEELRREIAALREEAQGRLETLEATLTPEDDAAAAPAPSAVALADARARATLDETLLEQGALGAPPAMTKKAPKDSANLLDETRWKVFLDIGREPGRWFPFPIACCCAQSCITA